MAEAEERRSIEITATHPLPDYAATLRVQTIHVPKVINLDCMPYWGFPIGASREGASGKEMKSYLTVDKDLPIKETLFYRLVNDPNVQLSQRGVTLINKKNGALTPTTIFHIQYKNGQARCFLPTVEQGICRACNVKTSFTLEVKLANEDGYQCYFYHAVKTGGMGSLNMVDASRDIFDLMEDIEELSEAIPGAIYNEEEQLIQVPFCNEVGDYRLLDFSRRDGGLSDLRDMVVSVRMIENDYECGESEGVHG